MSKTKYIKVSVSARLPEKTGIYIVEVAGNSIRSWFNGQKFLHNLEIIPVEYWLQEVPDYEDEMKEMLAKCMLEFGRFKAEFGQGSKLELEIKSLLIKLKQNHEKNKIRIRKRNVRSYKIGC